MGFSVTLMNAKGGVGKSTIAVALPEVLSTFHHKTVLIIDSDAQMSSSFMTQQPQILVDRQAQELTILNYLEKSLEYGHAVPWHDYLIRDISDIDDARSVSLFQGHLELMLFERELSERKLYNEIRQITRQLLQELKQHFDCIFIDCPPGISVLTEAWLREADYYISPVKPDYLSVSGLQMLRAFQKRDPEMTFAKNLGALINMKDERSLNDQAYHEHLAEDRANMCFSTVIPRSALLQKAAQYDPDHRSYQAKYPGDIGYSFRLLADEVIERTTYRQGY